MKITVNEAQPRKLVEVEVEPPWYRQHDVGGDTYDAVYYTRIELGPNGKLREVSLCHSRSFGSNDERWEVGVSGFSNHPDNSLGYTLGTGEYALTAAEWEEKRAEMETWMRSVGALPPREPNT